jgi:hypothetical protein
LFLEEVVTLALRIRLGGNTDAAKELLPTARKLLGDLTESMKFNNLKQDQRIMKMADGTVFKVKRVFGQDTVEITVPAVEVPMEEKKEEILATPKYRIKLFNFPIAEDEILTTSCLMRMTFYHRDTTELEDESKIVFDYKVPTDKDENGNLITSPEEYFGSEDNPGLEWDDVNECFMVDTIWFTDPYLGNTIGYATALGAEELKHFVTYSCKHCPEEEPEKYAAARQDQQYPEVLDDEERWNKDDLVEPSFSEDDILEDKISCLIGFYIVAQLGNYRVVWDAVLSRYAQTIINDSGDLLTDGDWPVHKDDLTDWYIGTNIKGGTSSQWGTQCTINTLSSCILPVVGNCETSQVTCEVPDHYLPEIMQMRDATKYDCYDSPQWYHTSDDYLLRITSNAIYSLRSIYGSVNGFDVVIACQMTRTLHSISDIPDLGNNISIGSDYYTVVAPWGECFVNDFIMNYGDGYNWTEDSSYTEEQRVICIHYKSDNIIFFCYGGHFRRNNGGDTFWKKDSIGTIGFYTEEKCSEIDPNVMDGCDNIQEGFNKLMQAYFDDVNAGEPRDIIPYFQHREGVV